MTDTLFKCFINSPGETAVRSPQKTLVRTEPWLVFCLLYGPQRAGVKKAPCREPLRLLKFPQPSHRSSPTLLPGLLFFSFPPFPPVIQSPLVCQPGPWALSAWMTESCLQPRVSPSTQVATRQVGVSQKKKPQLHRQASNTVQYNGWIYLIYSAEQVTHYQCRIQTPRTRGTAKGSYPPGGDGRGGGGARDSGSTQPCSGFQAEMLGIRK